MTKSPDAFRTISEVADALETPAHVLRFWESRFPQIKPVKRAGGRRYYRPADVALLTGIKRLLHDDGLTIRGVQKILREQGVRFVSGVADDLPDEDGDAALVAALAEASPQAEPPVGLRPAEAETAQIIALQSALREAPPVLPQDPDAPDMQELTNTPHDPVPPPRVQVVPVPPAPAPVVADLFSRLEPPAPDPFPDASPQDTEAEAPMTLWAEEVPADPPPAAPLLRITRIGQANPPASAAVPESAPEAAPEPAPDPVPEAPSGPSIAQRLRAMRGADLSADDRAALAQLRVRTAALHARLIAAQGPAAGSMGLGRTPT
jgi:DNA-binding transcriptional MerR regulator